MCAAFMVGLKLFYHFNAQKYILSRKAQRPRGIFCEVLAPAAFTRRRRDSGGEPRGIEHKKRPILCGRGGDSS